MKKFINVIASFDTAGNIIPLRIIWEGEQIFSIDRICDIRPCVSLRSGGAGMRYTCSIQGHQRFLYFEKGMWYIDSERQG